MFNGAEDTRHAAQTALTPEHNETVTFGTFNPASNTLDLGDAVTFDQYRVPVESREAFHLDDVPGYRAGAAHVPGAEFRFAFGWVRIAGDLRRVYATRGGREIRLIPPRYPVDYVTPGSLTDESWLARRIAAGDEERVGPLLPTSTYERRSYANLPPRRE